MSGVAKVLQKLKRNVESGDYYEAYQMYHSVSQRYLKQKKFQDAIDLLFDGCKNMIQYQQLGSVIDLTERLLEVFELNGLGLSDVTRAILLDLFERFPHDHSACENYVKVGLKWSSKHCKDSNGDPILHHVFGAGYFKVGQFYDAEALLVYGNDDSAKLLGLMEFEFSNQGHHEDPGYFLLRGLFPLLLLAKVEHARFCFDEFTSLYKEKYSLELQNGIMPSPHPLYNYAQTLLIMIEKRDGRFYTELANHFQPYLQTDSYLVQCVEKVGALYFRIGVKEQAPNPFADILKSMFGGQPQQPQITDVDMD